MSPFCKLLLAVALATVVGELRGEPLLLRPDQGSIVLSSHVSVLRDPSGRLTFTDIQQPAVAEQFKPHRAETLHFGFTSDAIWVRIPLQSAAAEPSRWLVELGHTRFELIDWFVVRNGALAEHLEEGNLRPLPANHHRYPVLPVVFGPKESVELYLWLRTQTSINIPLRAYTPEVYLQTADRSGMFNVFSFGVFSVLFVLGLIFALFTQQRGFLFFSLSIVSVGLIFLGTSGYWRWLEIPGWRFGVTKGVPFFNMVSVALLLVYLRDFFGLGQSMPKWDRGLKAFIAVASLTALAIPFAPYRTMMKIAHLQDLLSGCVATGTAVVCMLRGVRIARFYLLAWSSFWGLLTIEILQHWKLIPPLAAPDLMTLSGLNIGFTLFFIAMADRVRQMRLEKETAQNLLLDLQKDMTGRLEKQVEERTASLAQAKEEAEQANRYKAMFLANMSHEIRTPLSALVGLSQALCKQSERWALPAEVVPMLKQIRSGSRFLNVMLTNLLDISAIQTGKSRIHISPVELETWSHSVRDILQPIAENKPVPLVWNAAALAGQRLQTDPVRLSQILINLVHNAIKFSPTDSPVTVTFQKGQDAFAFQVADHGPGLPADFHKLLEAFEQNPGVVSGSELGVGLGLYVVKTNADLLGAKITAQSGPEGTTFEVSFKSCAPSS